MPLLPDNELWQANHTFIKDHYKRIIDKKAERL